jgi:NAD(P)-dependent dehydrogenase (short-subunit alcohol dehydrogenase family)
VQQDNAQELRNLAQEHSNLHLLQLDVTNEDEITNVASEIGKVLQEEGLNLVINNAALFLPISLEKVTADQMLQTFQTNAVGPLMIIKALLPFLKRAATKDQNPNSTSDSTKQPL